jgi:hypothetical protein
VWWYRRLGQRTGIATHSKSPNHASARADGMELWRRGRISSSADPHGVASAVRLSAKVASARLHFSIFIVQAVAFPSPFPFPPIFFCSIVGVRPWRRSFEDESRIQNFLDFPRAQGDIRVRGSVKGTKGGMTFLPSAQNATWSVAAS